MLNRRFSPDIKAAAAPNTVAATPGLPPAAVAWAAAVLLEADDVLDFLLAADGFFTPAAFEAGIFFAVAGFFDADLAAAGTAPGPCSKDDKAELTEVKNVALRR